MKYRWGYIIFFPLIFLSLVLSLLSSNLKAVHAQATDPEHIVISGWLSTIWGDGMNGSVDSGPFYLITDENGISSYLAISQNNDISRATIRQLDGKYVSVTVISKTKMPGMVNTDPLELVSIEINPNVPKAADPKYSASVVSGSQPWVSILCKFNDVPVEPKNLSYFQGMYASAFPGLDHYWREQSYGILNVAGSNAAGWFTLPFPRSTYVYDRNGDGSEESDLSRLFSDCTRAADPAVNFAGFSGINMMFNDQIECSRGTCWAYGGNRYASLDGVSKYWHVTWEPPWGYSDIATIEHEMGHGFGLLHSSGGYGLIYDSAWDVMSSQYYNCYKSTDPIYGCLGQHTNAINKFNAGWINPAQIFTYQPGTLVGLTIEQLALPVSGNIKMVKIPIGGSQNHFYTVEARRLVGYDSKLPGNAIVIHEVDTSRAIPAQVVDIDLNGNPNDDGAMWVVGETFTDNLNKFSVYVKAETISGFQISIGYVDILTPTNQLPGYAGKSQLPSPMILSVQGSPNMTRESFSVKIGDYYATISSVAESSGKYTIEIIPPVQGTDGRYDLQVIAGSFSDFEPKAVFYSTFADVTPGAWYYRYVEGFYAKGITTGCNTGPLRYCPDRAVTRAEMAVFILRSQHAEALPYTPNPDPSVIGAFSDVPVTGKEWMQPWIEEFYQTGMTTGCNNAPLSYCPERQVTRAEMAVFVLRAVHGKDYVPPAATGVFSDVPVSGKQWMQPWIEQFYREGITTGCAQSPLRFCPEQSVTRAEMATFLDRAFGFPQLP